MALNPGAQDKASFQALLMGFRVDRATATLPQTASTAIYNVTVGRILLLALVGEVTTVIQTQANNTKVKAVPTVGSTVDLCAVKDITALEAGGKLVLPAAFATALAQTNAGAAVLQPNNVVVAVGSIQLDCAASNTGSIKWSAFYIPLDEGAVLAAA